MKKLFSKKTNIIIAVLITGMFSFSFVKTDLFEISKNLDIFANLYRVLNESYVDETKPGQLMKTGIDAMLESLDPYTNYITENDIEDFMYMTTGEYGGIGALVTDIDGKITEKAHFKLFDLMGREMMQRAINEPHTVIDRGQLPAGIYFYTISNDKEILQSGKLIAQ